MTPRSTIALSTLGILCWLVMFLTGTDVWHFAGRPDFWRLSGAPYTDLRFFGYAFYVQLVVLVVLFVVAAGTAIKGRLIRHDN